MKKKRQYVKSGRYSKNLCPIPPALPIKVNELVVVEGPALVKPKNVPESIQILQKDRFIHLAQRGAVIAQDGDGFWCYKPTENTGIYDESLPVWSTKTEAIPSWATHVAFFPKPKENDISFIKPAGDSTRWSRVQV